MSLVSLFEAARDYFYDDKLTLERWHAIRSAHQKHQDKLERARRKRRERAMQRHAARSLRGAQ